MKKILLCIVVAVMAACTTNEIDEVRLEVDNSPKVYAVFADDDEQRVELNSELQSVWTEGDRFISFSNDAINLCSFTGSTGDRNGEFSVTNYNPYNGFDFRGKIVAFYPYAAYYTMANYTSDRTHPVIIATVNATQNYKKGSYDPTTNYMMGSSEDGQNYSFKNINGYLRLSVTGDKKVRSIAVKGNKSEPLAGYRFYDCLNTNTYGWYQGSSDTITLDCGEEGVQLTDSPTQFYITLVPTIFEEGITVEITFTDGTIFPKTTQNNITIKSNTILPMSLFETADSAVTWQTVTIYHSGDEIAAPILYGDANLVGTINWGDNNNSLIEPNSYIYRFTDEAESHQVVVKAMDATRFVLKSCQGVSKIDFSKF